MVAVASGTLLHRIVAADELAVNSAHHQAAADAPDGVVVNATAPDGVIEGIEAPRYRFCLGVQWHPEFHISAGDVGERGHDRRCARARDVDERVGDDLLGRRRSFGRAD